MSEKTEQSNLQQVGQNAIQETQLIPEKENKKETDS